MSDLLRKINLGLRIYHQAYGATKRQFNAKAITIIQNAKLRRLIHYCFENIKYYKELFERTGISPKQIISAQDLPLIPLLTKNRLQDRFWDFLPPSLPQCRVSRTSGSTGVPLCILSDDNSRLFNSAAVIRYRHALNIPLIGSPILTPLKTENTPYKKPHWTFLQGLHKTYYINPYIDNSEYEIRLLARLKKPAIIGITPAIKALAYKIQDGVIPPIKPIALLTTGECLDPSLRDFLETTFDTKVTDIYACNEAGDIAWQCRKTDGYHINADNCIVEILKDGKPVQDGQVGQVVITNLNRYSMPIIRYENGDLAKLKLQPCSCGCKLPMMAEIVGRTGEDIFLPSGKTVPWNQLKSLINHPSIRQFQIIQNHDGALIVRYVPQKHAHTEKIDKLLLYRYSTLLGPSIVIKIEKTEKITPAPSGKSKLVISHYNPSRK